MKTINTQEGKTCKPQRIPSDARLTIPQIQTAYDEIASQYEKRTWFDHHILGVARLKKEAAFKSEWKNLGSGVWNRFEFSLPPG